MADDGLYCGPVEVDALDGAKLADQAIAEKDEQVLLRFLPGAVDLGDDDATGILKGVGAQVGAVIAQERPVRRGEVFEQAAFTRQLGADQRVAGGLGGQRAGDDLADQPLASIELVLLLVHDAPYRVVIALSLRHRVFITAARPGSAPSIAEKAVRQNANDPAQSAPGCRNR